MTAAGSAGPVQVCRFESETVVEIHFRAAPDDDDGPFEAQASAAYRRLAEALAEHGATWDDVVAERAFVRGVGAHAMGLACARREAGIPEGTTARTAVGQPPCADGRAVELQALALLARRGQIGRRPIEGLGAGISGALIEEPGPTRILYLAGVTGEEPGDDRSFEEQARAMFRRGEALLGRAGLDYRHVMRTWIFVADIDRDYAALNRARREMFEAHRVHPPPASTGIQGIPHPPDRACVLDLRALAAPRDASVRPIQAPTMNEAPTYGADFSRGTRVDLPDRSILYISGTASIDDDGQVLHVGDVVAQARRMLDNVAALLAGQGASFADIVSAVTYVKRSGDVPRVRQALADRGFPEHTPHTLCVADVCRPEWLCEIEAVALRRARVGRRR